MPIIYRARPPPVVIESDYEQPQPSDADDSIVLSDLVRTGEASRLRRRGAMRLDHGLVGTQNQAEPSLPPQSPTVIVVGSPTWESESEERDGPVFARNTDRERSSRYGYARSQQQAEGSRMESQASRRVDSEGDDRGFALFCGGEIERDHQPGYEHYIPYEPSILPLYPPASHSRSSAPIRPPKKTNGCGAFIHLHASPRKRLGVWTAKSQSTSAVIGLDASYFDRTAVAKIVRSACGCVREGVGCAVCGNPLGTRYKPCKTAGEDIFSSRPRPSGPIYPDGPRYWHAHSHSHANSATTSSSRRPNNDFYVYTFFSNSVTSSPSFTFPPRPALTPHHTIPPMVQPQTQVQYTYPESPQQIQVSTRAQPSERERGAPEAEFSPFISMFNRGMTASPTPLSDVGEAEGEESEGYAYRYQYQPSDTYQYQAVPAWTGEAFDPDGEFIAEPNSPDKTGEMPLSPER